jgi:hypothetical protein
MQISPERDWRRCATNASAGGFVAASGVGKAAERGRFGKIRRRLGSKT